MADATETRIAPALTVDEWTERDVENGTFRLHVDQFGILYGSSYDHAWQFLQSRRHGMAALALHGQPYGFTREMLDGLCLVEEWANDYAGEYLADRRHRAKRDDGLGALADVIARIEALLPPEKPNA